MNIVSDVININIVYGAAAVRACVQAFCILYIHI